MEFEEIKRKWLIEDNWRAHVSEYVKLHKSLRTEGKGISPEHYSKREDIDQKAFRWWLEVIKLEDRFTFYRSFATEHLNRAKRSLDLLEQYIDLDQRLAMPLMRDAIIAYAALFRKNTGRVSAKQHLNPQTFIPEALLETHEKLCADRDMIFAHCDLGPRDPRVSMIGITLRGKGFYWEDYKALIPQFRELIETVNSRLETYAQKEKLDSVEDAFHDFLDPPPEALLDPGRPSSETS